MKRLSLLLMATFLVSLGAIAGETSWIRVNLAGYLPKDIKVAVFISLEEGVSPDFTV